MSGKRCLLDTNAIIALLRGEAAAVSKIADAEWIGISVISKLEFLSFPQLDESDSKLFREFESRVEVVSLLADDLSMHDSVVAIRHQRNLKLPDAIIAAAALAKSATLLTADRHFQNAGLPVEYL